MSTPQPTRDDIEKGNQANPKQNITLNLTNRTFPLDKDEYFSNRIANHAFELYTTRNADENIPSDIGIDIVSNSASFTRQSSLQSNNSGGGVEPGDSVLRSHVGLSQTSRQPMHKIYEEGAAPGLDPERKAKALLRSTDTSRNPSHVDIQRREQPAVDLTTPRVTDPSSRRPSMEMAETVQAMSDLHDTKHKSLVSNTPNTSHLVLHPLSPISPTYVMEGRVGVHRGHATTAAYTCDDIHVLGDRYGVNEDDADADAESNGEEDGLLRDQDQQLRLAERDCGKRIRSTLGRFRTRYFGGGKIDDPDHGVENELKNAPEKTSLGRKRGEKEKHKHTGFAAVLSTVLDIAYTFVGLPVNSVRLLLRYLNCIHKEKSTRVKKTKTKASSSRRHQKRKKYEDEEDEDEEEESIWDLFKFGVLKYIQTCVRPLRRQKAKKIRKPETTPEPPTLTPSESRLVPELELAPGLRKVSSHVDIDVNIDVNSTNGMSSQSHTQNERENFGGKKPQQDQEQKQGQGQVHDDQKNTDTNEPSVCQNLLAKTGLQNCVSSPRLSPSTGITTAHGEAIEDEEYGEEDDWSLGFEIFLPSFASKSSSDCVLASIRWFPLFQTMSFVVTWIAYAAGHLARKPLTVSKPLVQRSLGLSSSQLGWLDSANLLPYSLLQLYAGGYVDAYGPRPFLVVGLLVAGVCVLVMGMATSFPVLVLALAICGSGQAFLWPACTKALSLWFLPQTRILLFGWWGTCQAAGGLVGTYITASYIAQIDPLREHGTERMWDTTTVTWRTSFVPCAIIVLAAGFLSFWAVKDPSDLNLTREIHDMQESVENEEKGENGGNGENSGNFLDTRSRSLRNGTALAFPTATKGGWGGNQGSNENSIPVALGSSRRGSLSLSGLAPIGRSRDDSALEFLHHSRASASQKQRQRQHQQRGSNREREREHTSQSTSFYPAQHFHTPTCYNPTVAASPSSFLMQTQLHASKSFSPHATPMLGHLSALSNPKSVDYISTELASPSGHRRLLISDGLSTMSLTSADETDESDSFNATRGDARDRVYNSYDGGNRGTTDLGHEYDFDDTDTDGHTLSGLGGEESRDFAHERFDFDEERDHIERARFLPSGGGEKADRGGVRKTVTNGTLSSDKISLRDSFSIPHMTSISLSYFFVKLIRYVFTQWMPTYFLLRGYSPNIAGMLAIVYEVGNALGTVLNSVMIEHVFGGKKIAMVRASSGILSGCVFILAITSIGMSDEIELEQHAVVESIVPQPLIPSTMSTVSIPSPSLTSLASSTFSTSSISSTPVNSSNVSKRAGLAEVAHALSHDSDLGVANTHDALPNQKYQSGKFHIGRKLKFVEDEQEEKIVVEGGNDDNGVKIELKDEELPNLDHSIDHSIDIHSLENSLLETNRNGAGGTQDLSSSQQDTEELGTQSHDNIDLSHDDDDDGDEKAMVNTSESPSESPSELTSEFPSTDFDEETFIETTSTSKPKANLLPLSTASDNASNPTISIPAAHSSGHGRGHGHGRSHHPPNSIFSAEICIAALLMFFSGIFDPGFVISGAIAAELGEYGGRNAQASLSGIINGLGGLGSVVQGPMVGILADLLGWSGVFAVTSAMALGAAMVLNDAVNDEWVSHYQKQQAQAEEKPESQVDQKAQKAQKARKTFQA